MAPTLASLVQRHGISEGSSEPLSGIVISVVLSMLSVSALSAFTSENDDLFLPWGRSTDRGVALVVL